jgi:hypothetical protein
MDRGKRRYVLSCTVHVTCYSKLLKSDAPSSLSEFKSPRVPEGKDLEMNIKAKADVRTKYHHMPVSTSFGGLKKNVGDYSRLERNVSEPKWLPDDESGGQKGRWMETGTFRYPLVFTGSPPVSITSSKIKPFMFKTDVCLHAIALSSSLSDISSNSQIILKVKLNFPGHGNEWKTQIGPLPLTSGIAPGQSGSSPPLNNKIVHSSYQELSLPP